VALAIVLRGLDAPGPNHLRSAFGSGLQGLWDVAVNRVPLAYAPAGEAWALTVPLALCFIAGLVLAFRSTRRRVVHDVLVALAAGIAVSLLVNDSTAYILAGGIAAVGALVCFDPEVGTVRVPSFGRARLEAQAVAGEAAGSD
jgi:hypothetical protein